MIGAKCTACGKQRKYHAGPELLCPLGKRRCGEYDDYHSTMKFTPKPRPKGKQIAKRSKRNSSEKRKDYDSRRYVKSQPCAACGHKGSAMNPIDPCHLRTWKVTQCDKEIAMIPMCRFHHAQSHVMGWGAFFDLFPKVYELVISQGWEVTPDPFQRGRVILSHKEVA